MNRTKEECKLKAPDHLEGIPDTDAAITEASGDEAEGVLLGGGSRRVPPREAVEALGTGAGAGDGEIVGVRLEVELKDLEIGRGAEREIDGARHGAGGEVGRVGREGDKRRPRGTLDAGHGIARAGGPRSSTDLLREERNGIADPTRFFNLSPSVMGDGGEESSGQGK